MKTPVLDVSLSIDVPITTIFDNHRKYQHIQPAMYQHCNQQSVLSNIDSSRIKVVNLSFETMI